MSTNFSRARAAGFCLTAFAMAASFSGGAAASDFTLKGQTVNVIVSGGVGGGLNAYARTFMPYMARQLPGNPSMVAQNMPGGGGVQGVQYLFNVGRPDGTSVATTPAGPIKEPLMGSRKVNYDLRKFGWVGALTNEDTVCLVWHTSKIKTLDDARTNTVVISATGAGSNSTLGPLLMNELIGTKLKPIAGYDGGTSMLALERGEVDGRCTTLNSVRAAYPRWISENLIRVLFRVSDVVAPEYPDAPLVRDLLKSDADRRALAFFQSADDVQNPYFLPPATPRHILEAYRKAFDATVLDPEYLADAKKRRQHVVPTTGAKVEETIEAMYATDPAVVERVKKGITTEGRIERLKKPDEKKPEAEKKG